MSIHADSRCMQCYLERNMNLARQLGSEEQATRFFRAMLQMFLDAPEDTCAPWFAAASTPLLQQFYGLDPDRYRKEKEDSNAFVLERMDRIRAAAQAAPDPVYAGLQYAVLGNYIDFPALRGNVSFTALDDALEKAAAIDLDHRIYGELCRELSEGKELLYIADNAGEIGFDRICAELIAEKYPHLSIRFLVRGGPANNDATQADAAAVGIRFPVIGSGSCIPGTVLKYLSAEARLAMDRADVILSKGQGNVETLYGCGYNIYYAFLVKCPRFAELFRRDKLTPLLLRERRKA